MAKIGRNDLCSCGSGRKLKKCCGVQKQSRLQSRVLMITVGVALLAAIVAGVAKFTGDAPSTARVWDPVHGHFHDANGIQVP